MKNKLLTMAGALALLAVLGKYYAIPVLAQARAALVSDVDNPARSFVQLSFFAPVNAAILTYDPQYVVPPGKRLVVDTVSAMSLNTVKQPHSGLQVRDGANPIECSNGGGTKLILMPLAYQGTDFFGHAVFGGLARVQSYLETGHCLAISIPLNGDPLGGYNVVISGHLVTYP